jgi:hypothetical protein
LSNVNDNHWIRNSRGLTFFKKKLIKNVQSSSISFQIRKSYEGLTTHAKLHIMTRVNTTKRVVGASPKEGFE